MFVKDEEIMELADRWPPYNGKNTDPMTIRAWLSQYGEISDQRLAYKLLQSVRFFGDADIRQSFNDAHATTVSGLTQHISKRQRVRSDMLISFVGGVGKSGPTFAKLYASTNSISTQNILSLNSIRERIQRHKEIKAIVVADDFVGTGKTAKRDLGPLFEDRALIKLLAARNIKLHVVAVCGSSLAREQLLENFSGHGFPFDVTFGTELAESEKAFSKSSSIWESEEERHRAQELARIRGLELDRKQPLGYDNSQALVVFKDNCPNNTLPILWKNSPEWRSLFQRFTG